jgi:hypothetical protein
VNKILLRILSSIAFATQIKPPTLDKDVDPMAGLMGLMKVY